MKNYEEIKSELIEIAEVLKKFPENIQPKVFDILTTRFLGGKIHEQPNEEMETETLSSEKKSKKQVKDKSQKSTVKAKESISLIKDLNLRPSGKKSFRDFFDEKKPGPANAFNAVAVYYLSEILQMTGITPSHVYTCYKEVNVRPPEAFVQSLKDTASKNGYVDTSDTNNIKIPLRGKNYVEHDLPKPKIGK